MSPKTIQAYMRQRPFQPLRIFMSDGATYDIHQPGTLLVTEREILIAVPKPGQRFARHATHRDPQDIARIEPLPG
jgi:hypothetical protein